MRQPKMETKRPVLDLDNLVDYKRMLHAGTEGFKSFPHAIKELVDNSADWGATSIRIRFLRIDDEDCIQIIDDGRGFTDNGIRCAVGMYISDARDNPDMRGRNGTATKALVHHCTRFRLETKRSDAPLRTLDFTVDDLVRFLSKERKPIDHISEKPLPPDHPIKTTGSVITWFGLNSKPTAKRSATHLIENLARHLTPQRAEKVTVEDVSKKTGAKPLRPRELIGKRLKGSEVVEGVGPITWDLSVAAKPTGGERVEVWAFGPASPSWDAFIEPVRRDSRVKQLLCLGVLDHPHVMGHIDIPGWNKQYSKNSRDGFDASLYALEEEGGDALVTALAFIRRSIVPLVEREIGITEGQVNDTNSESLLDEVHRLILERTDAVRKPKDEKPELPWDVSNRRFALEPGDTVSFSLEGQTQGIRFVWDSSRAGGTLNAHIGTGVTYTSGKEVGSFTLEVREMAHPERSRSIGITIKDQLPLAISPPHAILEVGQEVTFSLRNTRHTSGQLHWIGDTAGGTLLPIPDGVRAKYTAGTVTGSYTIAVEDRKQPGRFRAQASITICSERHRPRKQDRREFSINGRTYVLASTSMPGVITPSYVTEQGDGLLVIKINMVHQAALYGHGNEKAMKLFVLDEVAKCVAGVEIPAGNSRQIFERAAQVLSQLLPK